MSTRTEFRLGWRRSLLGPVLIVAIYPVVGLLLLPLVPPDAYAIRWPAVAAFATAYVAIAWWQSRTSTTLGPEGLTGREVGRPWRLLRRETIAWHEIVAIEPRKYGRLHTPVVWLADGGWIRLRLPAARKPEGLAGPMAEILRWHRAGLAPPGPGFQPGPRPWQAVQQPWPRPTRLPRPSVRRRSLIAAGAALVIVTNIGLVVAVFVDEFRTPPEVKACELVSPAQLNQALPLASIWDGLGGDPPDGICRWKASAPERPGENGSPPERRISLSVYTFTSGWAADDHADDRAKNEARHVLHPINGVSGYTWTTIRNGSAKVEARAVVGGYLVKADLSDHLAIDPEARLTEFVQAVAARLEEDL